MEPEAQPTPSSTPPVETSAQTEARDSAQSPDAREPGAAAPDSGHRPFTPVSDIIDHANAAKLDWLGDVSAGRRVRLQKLGYDVPEKLANLRRSEIRRLSRELSVSEEVIRNEWVPAAEAFLRDRQS